MNFTGRTLAADLKQVASDFEAFLANFFLNNEERFSYGPVFEPLYYDLVEYVSRRGKRIRPLLLASSYRAFGGERPLNDTQLLSAALSMELLHTFILIHDDIIDQSERRRGLPTLHKLIEERLGRTTGAARVGQNVSIVLGDILFALAVDTLRSADFPGEIRNAAVARFLRYITDTGVGEISDILFGTKDIARVTTRDVSQMYLLKTTRYTFEAPLVIGGLLAGVQESILESLSDVIEPMGLAFQIQNDLLEYRQFKGVDRLRQTDLLEGKKTYLLRVAFERLEPVDQSILQLCLSNGLANDASISKIEQLIDKSGAAEELAVEVERLFALSFERLDELTVLSEEQRFGLKETLTLVRQVVQKPS